MRKLTVYVDAPFKSELPCVLCAIRTVVQGCSIQTKPIEMGYTEVTICAPENRMAEIESIIAPLV